MLAAATVAQAAGFTLSGLPYINYGNVNSYSMPISADIYASINGGGTGPGNPYYVPSGPGQIQDLVVIYTGANGVNVTTNTTGFDNAYGAPNGQVGYASMSGATGNTGGPVGMTAPTGDKSAEIANTTSSSWDANLLNMKAFLDGGNPVFFFNNNEVNRDQSLAIWARMWITDANGALFGRNLYLTNNDGAYGTGGIPAGDATNYVGTELTPDVTSNASTDYVQSGGQVCSNLGVVISCALPHDTTYNHNLGANQVAYAGDVPLLNTWFGTLFGLDNATLAGYSFHMDLKLGCDPTQAWTTCQDVQIDNGFEQLFLGRSMITAVPEPEVLGLVGLGLLGVGLSRRRRPV